MIRLKKDAIKLITGILMMLSGAVLFGCSHSELIHQDLLNISKNQMQDIQTGGNTVYGVAFEQQETRMKIQKLEIRSTGEETVSVKYGYSYSINVDDLDTASMSELSAVLEKSGFHSFKLFKEKYLSTEPILPDSLIRGVPKDLGQGLFNFAKKKSFVREQRDWRNSRV